MLSLSRHSRYFKITAIALLLFYGVASGRSFVPELCNTLSSMGAAREASISSFSTCCAVPDGSQGKSCPLCTLVCSLSEPVQYVSVPLLPENYDTSNGQAPSAFESQNLWNPASLRGPPTPV